MSVIIETTIGDITVDLYLKDRPKTCLNFLKLCKIKYYNLCLFNKIEKNFIAQTGDPTETGRGGESVFCHLYGDQAKYFDSEFKPRLKHEKLGTISMVNNGSNMNGSQFFLTLSENLTYLDEVHTVFGEVVEGFDILLKLNEAICDDNNRPYQDIRITHTVILHDPYEDPKELEIPDASPEPTREQLESGYIAADEEIDDTKGKNAEELEEKIKESEAKARATILEMVGDIPDADVRPPENVLFVCKLNPVTTSEDLEIIFSRFGPIVSCEVIKDRKTGESLQYAFIEFEKEEDCENAYFKMDNVLIDDRRIHVDFSQSVSKLNFDKDKKFSMSRNSKQNVVLKNATKSSDGYDLIFDLNDDNNETSAKKHTKRRSRTPEQKRSHSEKNKDKNRHRSRSPIVKEKDYDNKNYSSRARPSSRDRSHSGKDRHNASSTRKRQYEEYSANRYSSSKSFSEKGKSYSHREQSSSSGYNREKSPNRGKKDYEEYKRSSKDYGSSKGKYRYDSVSPTREYKKVNEHYGPRPYDNSKRSRHSDDLSQNKIDKRDKKCKSSHKESKRSNDFDSSPTVKHKSSKTSHKNKKKPSRSSSVSSSSSSSSSIANIQRKKHKSSSDSSSSDSSSYKESQRKHKKKEKSNTCSYSKQKKHKKGKYE